MYVYVCMDSNLQSTHDPGSRMLGPEFSDRDSRHSVYSGGVFVVLIRGLGKCGDAVTLPGGVFYCRLRYSVTLHSVRERDNLYEIWRPNAFWRPWRLRVPPGCLLGAVGGGASEEEFEGRSPS